MNKNKTKIFSHIGSWELLSCFLEYLPSQMKFIQKGKDVDQ